MGQSSSSRLEQIRQQLGEQALPPVQDWQPPHTGEIDIHILRNGCWMHEGAEIERKSLIRLFSRILRKDSDGFYLVTPQEKLKIAVDDTPFFVVAMEVSDAESDQQCVYMETSTGDLVLVGPKNRLWVEENPESGEPSPYVHIRHGLNALLSRQVFYELIDLGKVSGEDLVIKSANETFSLGKISHR